MNKSALVTIALLYTEGTASIDGATRMQKLVFLAQKESEVDEFYEFEAGDYGPFSTALARDLDELLERGIIEVNLVTREVSGIKREYNNKPLNQLLQYVYRKYDSYTTNTQLDTEALFDPDTRSEFLEPTVDESPYRKYIEEPVAFENDDGTWTARDTELHF
ncbi:MAG: hypothetical protein ABEI86_14915, partial [Halobacteriaceae archaeon]